MMLNRGNIDALSSLRSMLGKLTDVELRHLNNLIGDAQSRSLMWDMMDEILETREQIRNWTRESLAAAKLPRVFIVDRRGICWELQ